MIVAYRDRPGSFTGRPTGRIRCCGRPRTRSTTTSTPRNTTASQAERAAEREEGRPLEHRREAEVMLQVHDVDASPARAAPAGPSTSTARSRGRHCIATTQHGHERARPTARRSAPRRDRRAPAPRSDRAGWRRRRAAHRRAAAPATRATTSASAGLGAVAAAVRRRRTSAQPTIARHSSAASTEIQSAAHTWRCGVHSSTTSNDALRRVHEPAVGVAVDEVRRAERARAPRSSPSIRCSATRRARARTASVAPLTCTRMRVAPLCTIVTRRRRRRGVAEPGARDRRRPRAAPPPAADASTRRSSCSPVRTPSDVRSTCAPARERDRRHAPRIARDRTA